MEDISFDDIPLLRGLNRVDRASLIPSLEREEFPPGSYLMYQGNPGDALFIIVAGTASIRKGPADGYRVEVDRVCPGECIGEMALLSGATRSADVVALTELVALKLTKKSFDELFLKHPTVSAYLSVLLARRFSATYLKEVDERPGAASLLTAEHHPSSLVSKGGVAIKGLFLQSSTLAVVTVLVACWAFHLLLSSRGASPSHAVLSTLLLGATILWSLDVFSYHVVTIALPLLAVLFGIADPAKAFSGFSSPSWFLVLGVFAITAAISNTGLMYRLVLIFVRRFPPHYGSQTFALAISGLLLTPVIPSSNGRAALSGPLAVTLCETLGFKKDSPGAIGIAMACLLGFGHMSFLFMNGTATCYLALGLLPPEIGRTITWSGWLVSALPLGLVFFFASFIGILLVYRPKERGGVRAPVIDAQLRTLGPMTRQEVLSLATVIVTLAAFATQSLHRIDGAWIAMLSFLILFAGGVLNEKSVRRDIDWNFLVSFGSLVGFGTLIIGSGLTSLIAADVRPYLIGISGSPYLFLPVVSCVIHLVRFALPLPATLLIGILSIVPLSSSIGIHPLVIALVLLASVNPWIVPYQNSIYLNMLEGTQGKVFDHRQVRGFAICQVGAVLLAIVVSIPYWRFTGLIR